MRGEVADRGGGGSLRGSCNGGREWGEWEELKMYAGIGKGKGTLGELRVDGGWGRDIVCG